MQPNLRVKVNKFKNGDNSNKERDFLLFIILYFNNFFNKLSFRVQLHLESYLIISSTVI